MIYETEGQEFGTMMQVTWQSFGRNYPESETIGYWFDKLKHFELNAVSNAFDAWLKSQQSLPTIADIIKLCQHKVTMLPRLDSPLTKAENHRHANEVMDYVAKHIKPVQDYRAWAKKIIANPKNYPDISYKIAKEALQAKSA